MNNNSKKTYGLKPLSLAVGAAAAGLSFQAPLAFSQASALEEVIVTANRREESLQSVAMAVSAFSEDMMRDQGIVDLKGITERTPGFTMGMFNPAQPQLYIRGIGSNEDGAGGDQSVIVFIDEVYIGRSAGMDIDLFDLERVEVLRGPQGTLFGKNVVGGAVNMITKKPGEETELALEATLGDYNARTIRGLASGPLAGEGVYGKVSFSTRRRDGYMESKLVRDDGTSPPDTLDVNSDSLRLGLRFTPSESLEVNLSAAYSQIDKLGQPNHYFAPESGPVSAFYTAEAALIPNYDDKPLAAIYDDPGFFKSDSYSFTARVDWDLSDSILLTSITGLRTVDAENSDIIAGTTSKNSVNQAFATVLPLGTVMLYGANFFTDESDTFTQEIRLTSTDQGPLQWVAGVYYMKEETHRIESIGVGVDVLAAPGVIFGAVPFLPGSDDQNNETTSSAVFGQVTYDITDKLSVTAGARYTSEEKDMVRVGKADPLAIIGNFDFTTGDDWSETTGKLALEYQQSDDIFWYATYSEGFKSGGYQGMAATELAASTAFNPEFATLIEGGVKTEWMDKRVRFNASVFSTDYQDLQILQALIPANLPADVQTGVLITQNAADAIVEGVEIEFTAFPIPNLTIQGSATWLNTEFDNFSVPAGYRTPNGLVDSSRVGNELRNAPDMAYNLLVRYDWELASGAGLAAQLDWRHKDLVWQDPDNIEYSAVPEYDVGDFRLIYTTASGNTQVTGWVTNVTDEDYFIHNYPGTNLGNATPGAPRMVGLTVSWRN